MSTENKKSFGKKLLRAFLVSLGIFVLLGIVFAILIFIPAPDVNKNLSPTSFTRKSIANGYAVNNCHLIKNQYGIYEMYIEGDNYERGLIYGVLAKELIETQESFFVNQINHLVPNKFYQYFLKLLVAWFNKDIYKYIPEENLREIYGVSKSFSDTYDYIGPKYYRILNYHAAHDIGHALNDYNLVGCTSFAVNKNLSADSSLLIARNFDFYLGDDFAKNKIIIFVHPTKGYRYASYAWAGFTGVVSGMNEKGLTVTINASKSDVPFGSKTPISILAREILQYAKNINEAIAIAKKRETFVSETLLIGSAEDNRAELIEKSPGKLDTYQSNDNYLICSNHYQGEVFMRDSVNLENINKSDSKFRYARVKELLTPQLPLDYKEAASILRNKEGEGGKNIGFGNPKSLNQLLALHSVIFKPQQMQMWISTSPNLLGKFICYDMNKALRGETENKIDSLTIDIDPFLSTADYKKFEAFRITKQKIFRYVMLGIPLTLSKQEVKSFIENNPNSYITYLELGDYYRKRKEYATAIDYYEQSLKHEVASDNEIENINHRIESCRKEIKN